MTSDGSIRPRSAPLLGRHSGTGEDGGHERPLASGVRHLVEAVGGELLLESLVLAG